MNIGDKFFLFYDWKNKFSFSEIVGLNQGSHGIFEYKTKWEDEKTIFNHSKDFLEEKCRIMK